MSESQNGVAKCTVGGQETEDWDYGVCTLFAACTLSLIDSQKPVGDGLCTVCRKAAAMGAKHEHPAFLRHMVKASVLDRFPKHPAPPGAGVQQIRVITQPLAVVIERNGEVAFQAGMMLMGQPQESKLGFRLKLGLVFDEPLRGPKGPGALSELRLPRGNILAEEA